MISTVRFAAIALCLLAQGCASAWVRADGSDFYDKQLESDQEACRVHLETRADLTRSFAGCMRERGWVAAPESGTPDQTLEGAPG